MWTGCRRESWIYVWNTDSGELVQKIDLPKDSKGVGIMSQADDKVRYIQFGCTAIAHWDSNSLGQ